MVLASHSSRELSTTNFNSVSSSIKKTQSNEEYLRSASALSFDHPSIPAQRLCSTVTFSWSGGVPAFELQIVDATTDAVVEDFRNITGTSFEWVADGQVQGTTVVARVIDSTGQSAVTEHIPVSPGSSDACRQNVVTRSSTPSVPFSTSTTTAVSSTSTSRTTISTTSTSLPRDTSLSRSEPQSVTPSSAPDTTSISSTSTTHASSPTIITPLPLSSISPISAPDLSQSSFATPSTSPSTPTSPPPVAPIPAQRKSPSKIAIAAPLVALLIALGAILYWLRRRTAQKRNVVRSSGERADLDLEESCPLLSEPAVPERAIIAQRAWAGSSHPWAAEEQATFMPDGADNVLVIRRPRPRSTDAQASGWQSDFPSSAATDAGYSSFLSTTRGRPGGPMDRRTDSPIDSLVSRFPGGPTRPSSQCLPITHVPSYTRERPLSGTEIDNVLQAAGKLSGPSDKGERDDLSDMGSTTTLPPPYHHYAV
ncbi:hypothetical protein V8D89_000249 [Ganoderma adspersum]